MAVANPFDLAAVAPKRPAPWLNLWQIEQRDKEDGFPIQASEKLAADGKPYSMLIRSERSAGVSPLHIF